MGYIKQFDGTDMLIMGSYPNFNPSFDEVSFIKGGTEQSETRYCHLTTILQRNGFEFGGQAGAVAWNPSTREVWTASQGGDGGEGGGHQVRAFDEWLTNADSGGRLVATIPGANLIYGGAHAGGTGSTANRNLVLDTFVVIVNGRKLVAINMTTGAQATWMDLDNPSDPARAVHDVEYITEICPLARTTGLADRVAVIGTRDGGKYFVGEARPGNFNLLFEAGQETTSVIPGGTRVVREVISGLCFDGDQYVFFSFETHQQDDYFDEDPSHPFGGVQYFISSGECEVVARTRTAGGSLLGTLLSRYTIPTRVDETIIPDPFLGDVLTQVDEVLLGGTKTWLVEKGSYPDSRPGRLMHLRNRVGIFVMDRAGSFANGTELPDYYGGDPRPTHRYQYNKWWSRPIGQESPLSGGYGNIHVLGPGTAPWYNL